MVAEAGALVAAATYRLWYWEAVAESLGSEPLPEELRQRLCHFADDLESKRKMHARLKDKLKTL